MEKKFILVFLFFMFFVSSLSSDSSVGVDSRDHGWLLQVEKVGSNSLGGCPNYVWTGIK